MEKDGAVGEITYVDFSDSAKKSGALELSSASEEDFASMVVKSRINSVLRGNSGQDSSVVKKVLKEDTEGVPTQSELEKGQRKG